MSYTKGPWEAGGNGYQGWDFKGGYLGLIIGGDGSKVYAGPASFHSLRGKTVEECEANARLIAASPEMYEALSRLVGVVKVIKESEYDRASDWDRLDEVLIECERVMGKAVSS